MDAGPKGAGRPEPLPMPLQGILDGEMTRQVTRAHNRELAGCPVGQTVGRLDRIRPAQKIVVKLLSECVEIPQRLGWLTATAEA